MTIWLALLAARDPYTGIPENFGGVLTKDITNIHPLGLGAVLAMGCCLLWVPRRWAVLPFMVIACFISSAQKIAILGLDFNLLRIMVVFGVFRLLIKKEYYSFQWRPIDKMLIAWVSSMILIYTLQHGTSTAFINRLGVGFDAIGMYFLFRCLIQNWKDVDTAIFGILLISVPVVGAFLIEKQTSRNLFSIFGGVPEVTIIREGRLRCQGAFDHPILAGCFWASLLPLFAARWWKAGKDRIWAIIGVTTCTLIVFFCSSSTPVMGLLAGIIGGVAFLLRRYMRPLRWGILFTLIGLHLVMKAPVWHLIARVSAVGGSTSWHRYNLINQTVNHFHEWCLLGIRSTLHWGVFDITNQYVLEGVRGGFLTLALFVGILAIAYRTVGILWRQQPSPYRVALCWALGVCLFVHTVDFVGVSYFGQIYSVWFLLLAMIGSLDSQMELLRLSNKRMKRRIPKSQSIPSAKGMDRS